MKFVRREINGELAQESGTNAQVPKNLNLMTVPKNWGLSFAFLRKCNNEDDFGESDSVHRL
jgi:hypothetical protein